jgi:hypothetical protein
MCAFTDSAIQSQSAGLVESVLRGKKDSFPENRPKEKTPDGLLLLEPLGRDGD